MRGRLIFTVFTVVALFGGVLISRQWLWPRQAVATQARTGVSSTEGAPPSAQGKNNHADVTESALPILSGELLAMKPATMRALSEDVITLAANDSLSSDGLTCMRELVENRSLPLLIRNNAANVILVQRALPDDLTEFFLRIAENEQEAMDMREYAVQYATSAALAQSQCPKLLTRLRRWSQDPSCHMRATALLHWSRCAMEMPAGTEGVECGKVAAGLAGDDSAFIDERVTATSVLGRLRRSESRPLLRALLGTDIPALRRTAIGALRLIGHPDDQVLIIAAAQDSDVLVAIAASATNSQ